MYNRTRLSIAITLGLLLLALPAWSWGPPRRPSRAAPRMQLEPASFGTSGQYTGAIRGVIQLDGIRYTVAPGATIFEIGNGIAPAGTYVIDRRIFLSGVTRGSANIVQGVIICPVDGGSRLGQYPSPYIRAVESPSPL